MGCTGSQPGEGVGAATLSVRGFVHGGCVNRRGPVRRPEGWRWEGEAYAQPLSDPAWPLDPHRELAYQIAEQFRVLGKPLGLKDCIIVGGMGMRAPGKLWVWDPATWDHLPSPASHPSPTDMVTQALELSRKPHVVIATPGRLADHLRSSSTFSIKKIHFLVTQYRVLIGPFGKRVSSRLSSRAIGIGRSTAQGTRGDLY